MQTMRTKLRKVALFCTGSIGIIDIPRLVLILRRAYGSEVHVIMSKSAARFITPYCLEVCSGNKVITDTFNSDFSDSVPHINMMSDVTVCLVAPATANLIGKVAAAICDDAVTTFLMAAPCPTVLVPSMNETMWNKPALQDKVAYLRDRGYSFVAPTEGLEISTLENSCTSMPSPDGIVQSLIALL